MSEIAVLGAGLAGCCTAIALADAGQNVTLYERNDDLVRGASYGNEGKIHLGYVYAGDKSLATARRMISGALSFEPLIHRYLGAAPDFAVSSPFVYCVHRESQLGADEIAGYLRAVDACIAESVETQGRRYFGRDVLAAARRMDPSELGANFDSKCIVAAFHTTEIAIEPETLATLIRARVRQDPRIDIRLQREVTAIEEDGTAMTVVSRGRDGDLLREKFVHVVNALWDGRLAVDASLGLEPGRRWIHRLKYGVRFVLDNGRSLPTTTLVLGPFGDTVAYGDGSFYLSWYPAGMTEHSLELQPPRWPGVPVPDLQARITSESLSAFAEILPVFATLDKRDFAELRVKGGVIVAWGKTDIDDPQSVLHVRRDIGVTSKGRYHSIDTGKLTMAPYFASVCAERILSG